MLIEGKTNGKARGNREYVRSKLWPHHARNKPDGKSDVHSVAACIDM